MESGLPYYKFYPQPQGVEMAKLKKPVYEFELDDDEEELDDNLKELLYERYMEDISEILGRAYQDIGKKVQSLVDALEKDPE